MNRRARHPDFVIPPDTYEAPRNPERHVGRWMIGLAIVAAVLWGMGVI